MARKKLKDKPEKNRYTLRENMTEKEGDTLVEGPEFIYRSLDQAYLIAHKLEEQDAIVEEWTKRQKKRKQDAREKKRKDLYAAHGEEAPDLESVGKE